MKKKTLALILAIATIISVFAISAVPAYAKLTPISNPKLDYQPSYPLSSYKDGSYFNDSKTSECTDHKTSSCDYSLNCSCTHYDKSIQCMAFAKYVSDQYAHRTSWSYNKYDTTYPDQGIANNPDSAKKAFNDLKIPKYAYVRVDNRYNSSGHSFILISYSDSGVTMYDANFNGGCKVEYHTVTYKNFAEKYKNISVVMSHKFSNISNAKNNDYDYTKYHKVACSSSGCTGYKLVAHTLKTTHDGTNHIVSCTKCSYSVKTANTIKYTPLNSTSHKVTCSACDYNTTQAHFAKTTGTNKTCLICGAKGIIVNEGVMSTGDEIASADNETASIGDKTVIEDDVIASADEETAPADEETVPADDETITADEETVTVDDETVTADDETVPTDDENVSIDDIIN